MICLQKDCLKLILDKLALNDFYDLLIFNKLSLCQNFYICLKSNNSCKGGIGVTPSKKSYTELKILNLSEKCLESVLINRKQTLILDSVSYLLFLIIYNM
jgi:hypothetical protein